MSIIARDDDFPIFMVGTNSPAKSRASFYCPDYYYYYQIVQTRFESVFNASTQWDILYFYIRSIAQYPESLAKALYGTSVADEMMKLIVLSYF